MGELHELCVRQKTLYKRHALRGYQRWVIDATVKGRHHYRNMRINKEIFSALVQYRVEEVTEDYNDMDIELKALFFNLGEKRYCRFHLIS